MIPFDHESNRTVSSRPEQLYIKISNKETLCECFLVLSRLVLISLISISKQHGLQGYVCPLLVLLLRGLAESRVEKTRSC